MIRTVLTGMDMVLSFYMKDNFDKKSIFSSNPYSLSNFSVRDNNGVSWVCSKLDLIDNKFYLTVRIPDNIHGLVSLNIYINNAQVVTCPTISLHVINTKAIVILGFNDRDALFASDCLYDSTLDVRWKYGTMHTARNIANPTKPKISNAYSNGPQRYSILKTTKVLYNSNSVPVEAGRNICSGSFTLRHEFSALLNNDIRNLRVLTFQSLCINTNGGPSTTIFPFSFCNLITNSADYLIKTTIANGNLYLEIGGNLVKQLPICSDPTNYFNEQYRMMLLTVTLSPVAKNSLNWKMYINGIPVGSSSDPVILSDTFDPISMNNTVPDINFDSQMSVAFYGAAKTSTWLRKQALMLGFA